MGLSKLYEELETLEFKGVIDLFFNAAFRRFNPKNRNKVLKFSDVKERHGDLFNNVYSHSGKVSEGMQAFGGYAGCDAKYFGQEINLLEKQNDFLSKKPPTDKNLLIAACFEHVRLIHIHPFSDGNGRTTRSILKDRIESISPSLKLNITDKNKEDYFESMDHALRYNNLAPFLTFVNDSSNIGLSPKSLEYVPSPFKISPYREWGSNPIELKDSFFARKVTTSSVTKARYLKSFSIQPLYNIEGIDFKRVNKVKLVLREKNSTPITISEASSFIDKLTDYLCEGNPNIDRSRVFKREKLGLKTFSSKDRPIKRKSNLHLKSNRNNLSLNM